MRYGLWEGGTEGVKVKGTELTREDSMEKRGRRGSWETERWRDGQQREVVKRKIDTGGKEEKQNE